LVFLIHTELRCTVNHTSDLKMVRFEVLRAVRLKRNIFSVVMLEAACIDETSVIIRRHGVTFQKTVM